MQHHAPFGLRHLVFVSAERRNVPFQNPKELKYKYFAYANQYPCISSVFVLLIPLMLQSGSPNTRYTKNTGFRPLKTQMTAKWTTMLHSVDPIKICKISKQNYLWTLSLEHPNHFIAPPTCFGPAGPLSRSSIQNCKWKHKTCTNMTM
jgi:hypothetical protein